MSQVVIDHPKKFATVYSTDYKSPARPYIREYHLKTFEDLYEIGVIPKHIRLEHLRTARAQGLHAMAPYLDRASTAEQMDSMQFTQAEHTQLIQKQANMRAMDTSVRVMADTLAKLDTLDPAEATLIAKKVLTFDGGGIIGVPIWRQVEMADDLIIKTPLFIDGSISSLIAKDVVIHRDGELHLLGTYFLLRCDVIEGEVVVGVGDGGSGGGNGGGGFGGGSGNGGSSGGPHNRE